MNFTTALFVVFSTATLFAEESRTVVQPNEHSKWQYRSHDTSMMDVFGAKIDEKSISEILPDDFLSEAKPKADQTYPTYRERIKSEQKKIETMQSSLEKGDEKSEEQAIELDRKMRALRTIATSFETNNLKVMREIEATEKACQSIQDNPNYTQQTQRSAKSYLAYLAKLKPAITDGADLSLPSQLNRRLLTDGDLKATKSYAAFYAQSQVFHERTRKQAWVALMDRRTNEIRGQFRGGVELPAGRGTVRSHLGSPIGGSPPNPDATLMKRSLGIP